MEGAPTVERVAGIGLDQYLEALPLSLSVDGSVLEDDAHLFYYWLAKTYPDVGYVDGASLEDLYLKNVVNGTMSQQDFFRYCDRNHLLVPPHSDDEGMTFHDLEFKFFLREHAKNQDEGYSAWAEAHHIPTTPGSIMRFHDTDGNEYRVRTDVKNRGQIIA